MEVFIGNSANPKKKHTAIFYKDGKKVKTTHFGSKGMSDYTIHKDPERKKRWEARHRVRENWNAFMTAGALSKHILWNKTSKSASISDYLKRFNLKRIKSPK
jgi:hypothetical protein